MLRRLSQAKIVHPMKTQLLVAAMFVYQAASGQGGVAPPPLLGSFPVTSLNAPQIAASATARVSLVHLAGDAAEIYYCVAECRGLASAAGGMAGLDLLSGQYNSVTGMFVPNLEIAIINTTADEYCLKVHTSGIYGVFERQPQGFPMELHLAGRSSTALPWQDLGAIQIPLQSYYDASLVNYNGGISLAYRQGSSVAVARLDLQTLRLATAPQVVAIPPSGQTTGSIFPIVAPDDQMIGIAFTGAVGQQSDIYCDVDLDPNTSAHLMYDSLVRVFACGNIGGRLFYSDGWNMFALDVYLHAGGRSGLNSLMTASTHAPPDTATGSWFSVIAASQTFTPAGIPISGISGSLGLSLQAAYYSPLLLHRYEIGLAVWSIQVPAVTALHGVGLPSQAIGYYPALGRIVFSNTAMLKVD